MEEGIGTGGGLALLLLRGGRRKGRAPVGEAWFVDGRMRNRTLARRRRVWGE